MCPFPCPINFSLFYYSSLFPPHGIKYALDYPKNKNFDKFFFFFAGKMSRDHFEQLCSESLDGKLVNVRKNEKKNFFWGGVIATLPPPPLGRI